jgi:hypothetical protein
VIKEGTLGTKMGERSNMLNKIRSSSFFELLKLFLMIEAKKKVTLSPDEFINKCRENILRQSYYK